MPFLYNYTGSEQKVTLAPGKWRVECWGASGGSVSGIGGKGAYASAVFVLLAEETFYLYVGEGGKTQSLRGTFNGGGKDTKNFDDRFGASGGGATDVRLVSKGGVWSDIESLESRVLIAGRAVFYLYGTEAPGGGAGAMIGGSGSFSQCDPKTCISPDPYINATGGTNEKGGIGGNYIENSDRRGGNGALGKGGDGCKADTGAGGGGGYYGGGDGGTVNNRVGSGAGGSSYAYFPGEMYPKEVFIYRML